MGSKTSVARCALYVLLMAVAATVGVTVGFAVAYVYKDCDSDEEVKNGDATEHPVIIFNHAPGPCQLIDGVETGSEDMVTLPSGLVMMTAGMKNFLPRDRPDLLARNGSLKLFDFNDVDGGASVIPITNEDNFNYADFNPHGLSAWTDNVTGRVVVFVVNHNYIPDKIETMEKFAFNESTRMLTHLETISHDNMIMMNNVKATGPDTFFYTNFLSTKDPDEGQREVREQVPSGSIGYYDGAQARILSSGYKSPNGINISPDGRYLYVAGFATRSFLTFKVAEDQSITLKTRYKLWTQPDNIDVVGEYAWIGCHLYHDQLVKYTINPNAVKTPSQVLRLKIVEGKVMEMTEVYMDDGHKFSGITVAVTYGKQMLMGSLFTKAALCNLTYVG